MSETDKLLYKILKILEDRNRIEYTPIADNVVVPAGNYSSFDSVPNNGFTRARIFISALFTENHIGGVTVELYYGNCRIGRVVTLKSSAGTGTQASEPIDISHLSAFNLIVKNHDTSHNTIIKNFKIVLYNEGGF